MTPKWIKFDVKSFYDWRCSIKTDWRLNEINIQGLLIAESSFIGLFCRRRRRLILALLVHKHWRLAAKPTWDGLWDYKNKTVKILSRWLKRDKSNLQIQMSTNLYVLWRKIYGQSKFRLWNLKGALWQGLCNHFNQTQYHVTRFWLGYYMLNLSFS